MDETAKVIIATISGFIIAFFSEPVKSYFVNKSKLADLRLALYKELYYNYSTLAEFDDKTGEDEKDEEITDDEAAKFSAFGDHLVRRMLRTECYEDALKNQISLFYKLDESHMINTLEGRILGHLIHLYDDFGKFLGEQQPGFNLASTFQMVSKTYQDSFLIFAEAGVIEPKILKKIMKGSSYKELMKKAKDAISQVEE